MSMLSMAFLFTCYMVVFRSPISPVRALALGQARPKEPFVFLE